MPRLFYVSVKEEAVDAQSRQFGLQIYSLHSYLKTITRSKDYTDCEECCLLGHDAKYSGRLTLMLWKKVLRQSSGRHTSMLWKKVLRQSSGHKVQHVH